MVEYISRDDGKVAAWEILEGMGYSSKHNDRLVEDVDAVFDEIPAADVRPVRRGKWLPIIEGNEYGETYQTGCYCSECNEVLQHEPNFCPNCGADMRPEEGRA